jgi:branched-chain amino acid transport system permease protein
MIQDQRLSRQEPAAMLSRLQQSAIPSANPNWLVIGVMVVLAILLPWLTLRLAGGRFITHLLITFFVWGIVTQCWNLIMGVSGIYSFGQLALYAVGGWTTGILALHFGWNPLISIWLAPIAAVVAALIIGLPTLRLRGAYVVLLTLAFHELLRNYVVNGPTIVSGGGYGLRDVPKLPFEQFGGGWEILLYYYFGLTLFAIATYAIWRILHSPIGMAFRALRDSEDYAVSRGVDRFRFKLFLFAFSAFFTGLAGGFMTHYQGAASPSLLAFGVMINLLAMIVLGGWGTFWGPIVGTAILTILPEVLRSAEAYRNLTLGIALALIAVLAPRGLAPLLSQAVRNLGQRLRKRDVPR